MLKPELVLSAEEVLILQEFVTTREVRRAMVAIEKSGNDMFESYCQMLDEISDCASGID